MNNVTVYAAINRNSFKLYIGQTINTLSRRMRGHWHAAQRGSRAPFHRALRKYGKDGFDVVILAQTYDKEYAYFLERLYIAFYKTGSHVGGYNASIGGASPALGMRHTPEWKAQHSAQMSGANHPLYGVPCSKETKQRMSKTRTGRMVRPDVTSEEVCKLYLSGMTTRALAAHFKINRCFISMRLKRAGIKMRPNHRLRKHAN